MVQSYYVVGDKSWVAGVEPATAGEPPERKPPTWGRRPPGSDPSHPKRLPASEPCRLTFWFSRCRSGISQYNIGFVVRGQYTVGRVAFSSWKEPMKTGRNDPCPCGSGKKYKKCCLAKDQAAPPTRPMAFTPAASVAESPAPESLFTIHRQPDRPSRPPQPPKAPKPPLPPDPITERSDRRWKEFESQGAW